MTTTVKGRFTFRASAVLLALSAVGELLTWQADVPLFGTVIGGGQVAAYHVFYGALFSWLAIGLWTGSRSGYYTLFTATLIYSADRLQLVLAHDTLVEFVRPQLASAMQLLHTLGMGEVLGAVNPDYLLQQLVFNMTVMAVTMMLCWWGFAAYGYYRRDYFGIGKAG